MMIQQVYRERNRIVVGNRLGWSASIDCRKKMHFLTTIEPTSEIVLDLARVGRAYPNGVVPIVAEITRLRKAGFQFSVIPPTDEKVSSLFSRSGWLHFLDPEIHDSPKIDSIQSLPLLCFSSDEELNDIVSRVVEICIQQLVFATGIPQAFEWALNEIAGKLRYASSPISDGHGPLSTNVHGSKVNYLA